MRSLHEKLFFAPILDTLSGVGALTPAAAEERLSAFGFSDVARTRDALRELSAGLTRHSRVMQQLLPVVLGWLSDARPRSRAAAAPPAHRRSRPRRRARAHLP